MRKLVQAPNIARAILDSELDDLGAHELEHTIYDGYSELIDFFTDYNDPLHGELMPNFMKLKELLGGTPLPNISDFAAVDYLSGMRAARPLMLEGQEHKQRRRAGGLVTWPEIEHAIGAPSVDTDPRALAVGTAGHVIERMIFSRLKKQGIDTDTWVKDQVLWALEDVALLMHAHAVTYGKVDATLTPYFTGEPNPNGGGMGWRKPEQVQQVVEGYQRIETEEKSRLLAIYEEITGETYGSDTQDESVEEVFGNMYTSLLELDYDPDLLSEDS